jgi:TnpA family transposase
MISLKVLRRINAQHTTTAKLEAAVRDVIGEYTRFELPFLWGSGQAAIVDGTHEAVYIFDGLLKNLSALQPNTLHADTHGQAEPVFGLAALLDIKPLPRMRTCQDVTFHGCWQGRPSFSKR